MRIASKEYKETITVYCHDNEREDTKDWLSDKGFEFDLKNEFQMSSNNFHLVAHKKTVIHFSEPPVLGATMLEAARNYLRDNKPSKVRVRDDEYSTPEEIKTPFIEHPLAISFRTYNSVQNVCVYVQEKGDQFEAIGWSHCD